MEIIEPPQPFLQQFCQSPLNRLRKVLLAEHSAGLIGTSACLKGEINVTIVAGDLKKAEKSAGEFREIFGEENFYVELHDHGIEAQHLCNRALIEMSKRLGIPLVATNEYIFSSDRIMRRTM